MKYIYPAVFTKEVKGGYSVNFPDVPSCYTCGENLYDAMKMAKDVLALTLYDLEQDKKEIPVASDIKDIIIKKNEFVSLVAADTMFYERFYSSKTVKKNCTLPYWIEKEASERNINFSQVLQEALQEKLQEVK